MKDFYDVSEMAGARLTNPTKIVRISEVRYVAVYESQLKNWLRFPIMDLLREVINHYGV